MRKKQRQTLSFLGMLTTVAVLWQLVSCSSSKTNPVGNETEQEKTTSSADTTTADASENATSLKDSEPATEAAETDLIDHSNEIPLEPTTDCTHPEVTANCADGWCRIPKGCFIFGSVDSEGNFCRGKYSEDQAQVTLTHDFEIRQTETTQVEWQDMGFQLPNPISQNPCPECPIAWITIYEAMAYCNALSVRAGYCYTMSACTGTIASGCPEGELNVMGCTADDTYVCTGNVQLYDPPYECPGYRLPTTAEWEYAARAGTRTATYAGDFEEDIPEECLLHPSVDPIAWHCGNTERIPGQPVYLTVRQKTSNGFGLYDMLGNVEEYCGSTHQNRSLNTLVGQEGPLVNPAPPLEEYDDQMEVVSRGAAYTKNACYARSAYGAPGVYAKHRIADLGFRPVRTLDITLKKSEETSVVSASKNSRR